MAVQCGDVVHPGLAFLLTLIFVVGSAMARISIKSRSLWIVGPSFAFIGGFCVLMFEHSLTRWQIIFGLMFGIVIGGWFGGWMERKESGI